METSKCLDKTEKRDPERNASQYLNHLKRKREKNLSGIRKTFGKRC